MYSIERSIFLTWKPNIRQVDGEYCMIKLKLFISQSKTKKEVFNSIEILFGVRFKHENPYVSFFYYP